MDSCIVIKLTANENNIIKNALESYEQYLANVIKDSKSMQAVAMYENLLDLTRDIKDRMI